jgi:hypothetical protein
VRIGPQDLNGDPRQSHEGLIVHPYAQSSVKDQDTIVDCIEHHLSLTQPLFFYLDRSVAEDAKRLRHAADFVPTGRGEWCVQLTVRYTKHTAGERLEPPNQPAVDIEPNNQRRAQNAGQHDRGKRNRTHLPHSPRFDAGGGNVQLGTGNEPIDRFGQTARKDGVLGQYSLASS